MSRAMTIKEFGELIEHIEKEHPVYMRSQKLKGHSIKYIYPSIDMRDNKVFAVAFNDFSFGGKEFHTQNECRDLPESLFERIMKWLDKED